MADFIPSGLNPNRAMAPNKRIGKQHCFKEISYIHFTFVIFSDVKVIEKQ